MWVWVVWVWVMWVWAVGVSVVGECCGCECCGCECGGCGCCGCGWCGCGYCGWVMWVWVWLTWVWVMWVWLTWVMWVWLMRVWLIRLWCSAHLQPIYLQYNRWAWIIHGTINLPSHTPDLGIWLATWNSHFLWSAKIKLKWLDIYLSVLISQAAVNGWMWYQSNDGSSVTSTRNGQSAQKHSLLKCYWEYETKLNNIFSRFHRFLYW